MFLLVLNVVVVLRLVALDVPREVLNVVLKDVVVFLLVALDVFLDVLNDVDVVLLVPVANAVLNVVL